MQRRGLQRGIFLEKSALSRSFARCQRVIFRKERETRKFSANISLRTPEVPALPSTADR
jgi:hypothetical protein